MNQHDSASVQPKKHKMGRAGGPPPGVMPMGGPPPGVMPMGGPPPGVMPMGGPPPGAMPMGGPPPGMMPGGKPSDQTIARTAREIMPDFQKYRSILFKIDAIMIVFSFLLELVITTVLQNEGLIPMSRIKHLIFYVFVPTLLNVIFLLIALLIEKHMHPDDLRKNYMPVTALACICAVISITHCLFFAALLVTTLPIVTATIFSNKKMSRQMTILSILTVVAATVRHFYVMLNPSEKVWIIPEGISAVCILLCVDVICQILLSMTEMQKGKLISFAINIKAAHEREKAANNAKSAFLANMSHEIRTPINAILGMNEMILRENENQQIGEYAENIRSAGNSLLYLVNDVLDFSKIESGKFDLVETQYETSSFIHDIYCMFRERATAKGLELTIECDPTLPAKLKGDEPRIRQIASNLLSNAVKYTQKGSIHFSVKCQKEEDRFSLIFSVKDTGIGIKEENLAQLFTQFSRFDLEKNRSIEGTGLGLALTKQLITLMNGDIQVSSIYGTGTTFTATIPQQVIDDTQIGDFHKRYDDIVKKSTTKRKSLEAPDAKILVVDDVAVNLKVMTSLLKVTKIQVDTAKNGPECLELTAKTVYDMIFMDHMMPDMDGIETYRRIREDENQPNRGTPVVMLTANAISGVKEQYLSEGFVDYLSKPIKSDKLEQMLMQYLPKEKILSAPEVSDAQ